MKTIDLIKELDNFAEWRLLKHDNQPDPIKVTSVIQQASDRLTSQHLLLERCYEVLHSWKIEPKLLSDVLTELDTGS